MKTFIRYLSVLALLALSTFTICPVTLADGITSIYDCSWASDGVTRLLVNVRGDSTGGYAGFSGPDWTSQGAITDVSASADADGSTVVVTANMLFSHVVNGAKADYIQAKAVFVGDVDSDGSQREGVTITDLSGNVLASVPVEPVVRGNIGIY